jgi:hypothetical protein
MDVRSALARSYLSHLDCLLNEFCGVVPLAVSMVLGVAESRSFCDMTGTAGLEFGGSAGYRASDLDGDGWLCGLVFTP